ncbi:MAG: glycoside hydrolase family 16 protein [Kiritimatiellae bacterium]|nr:glycoside hydrolase family 16 protein [Kiritimatiellia bacterium]
MKGSVFLLAGLAALSGVAAPHDGRRMVWSDEFDGQALDATKWKFHPTMNSGDCVYTNDSRTARVEDGCLHLLVVPSGDPGKPQMLPRGVSTRDRMAFKYGYLEMRAKVPFRHGAWPSFWMTAQPGLQRSAWMSEVDIFEVFSSTNAVVANLHKWAGKKGHFMLPGGEGSLNRAYLFKDCSKLNDEFHVYGFEWTPAEMSFYVDGEKYATLPIDDAHDYCPKEGLGMSGHHDFHNIHINNEIFTPGHGWCPDEFRITLDDKLPIDYYVDWMRLWQKDGEEIRCPGESLFSSDRFTVLNIAPFSPGSEGQLAKEMVEYRDRTGGDVVLYSLTLNPEGFPAMRKAECLVDSYRKFRRALEGSGIKLGVLVQAVLGHWPRVDKDEEPWARSVTLEGKTKRFCPADPGCRRYIHDVARMLAQEKPCFIMLDDDVHASGTFGVECFCERHVAMFNGENGTSHTAESLRAAVKGCKPGDAVCTAFQKMQRAFVDDLVDAFRAAVDEVDPSIPSAACMPYREHRFAGFTAMRAAARGQEPVLRIDNALYGKRSLVGFAGNIAYTMAICDWWRSRGVQHLLDESDTWPHNRWSMSASLLAMKLQAAAFCGLHGSKLWYCNAHKGAFPVSRAYTDALAAQRGVCNAIAAAVRGSRLSGVVVPTTGGRVPWHPSMQYEPFVGDGNWGEGMAGGFGVPFCCRHDFSGDEIYAIGGADTVDKLDDKDLNEIFRRRVLVDGAAAIALTRRGLHHLAGVKAECTRPRYNSERDLARGVSYAFSRKDETPLLSPVSPGAEVLTHLCYSAFDGAPDVDVVSPGMVLATNALGGRVVTTAFFAKGYPWQPSLTDARKAWFLMALSKLGWDGWAVLNDQDALALERRCADGSTLLAVFNTNFDEMETVRLRAPYAPKAVEVLAPDGAWRRVEARATSGEMTLPVRLPCSHASILRMYR